MDTVTARVHAPGLNDLNRPLVVGHDLVPVDTGAEVWSPDHEPTRPRCEQRRNFDHVVWKWIFRAAMISGIVTMFLTLALVLR